jgi:hypothetical protein
MPGADVSLKPANPSAYRCKTISERFGANSEDMVKELLRKSLHVARLEARQARPSREFAIDPSNADSRHRLESIEAEIAELRKVINTVATESAEPSGADPSPVSDAP